MKTNTVSLILIALLTSFAFLQRALAVDPPPDGGYPGFNTAEGQNALKSLTTGVGNAAVGWYSLFSNTDGSFNTALGAGTLLFNVGDQSTGEATRNTAVGAAALLSNTTGSANTAFGAVTLESSTTASFNTATGESALASNTTGDANTAIGQGALFTNTTGTGNTALGSLAGSGLTTGNTNVYVGAGTVGVAGENNHTYIRNINTTTVSGAGTDTVTVDLTTGLIGHFSSSRRYKENITPMGDSSEALYRLKPVSYRFKKEIDRNQGVEYGLVAEDVAQVDSNLAIRDGKGQIESVRYHAVNAMLLNEFLKEHRKNEQQESKIEQQEATISRQQRQIDALTAGLQKVSAQLEVSKAAPQTVLNSQ